MSEAVPVADPNEHDDARDGTLYWTLSLYVAAQDLPEAYRAGFGENPGEHLRQRQLAHLPSLALRNAMDPLFNDIADRDYFGRPRDFLFAAGMRGREWSNLSEASGLLLDEMPLEFILPERFSWVTEGTRFHCNLESKARRRLDLRRFWFAHSDGALSYHLSFAHHYGAREDAYAPETYYFLSLLQKLAAPKEFMLDEALLQALAASNGTSRFDPLPGESATDDLGIAPFDIRVAKLRHSGAPKRFWHFVHDLFAADARELFVDVFGLTDESLPPDLSSLLRLTDVIEVPGLRLPRCRYLFHIDDKRFFNHLLPVDQLSGQALPRKRMVREQCFAPYRELIDGLSRKNGKAVPDVYLGEPPAAAAGADFLAWSSLDLTAEYQSWMDAGVFQDAKGQRIADEATLRAGLLAGTVMLCVDDDGNACEPVPLQIPAYRTGRTDCLDYLFLAGFNQNIIDWLNQDTSEILDSIDPIYPTEEVQADERFFVRYANHRGMITYVAGSRSLEIGNDYLGTCPYAFLIHVLAMHNEFLARDHEERTNDELEGIDGAIQTLRPVGERKADLTVDAILAESRRIEDRINQLKRATYRDYERHRYLKVFRYDTEALVFETLSELRGTDWRGLAMERALRSLEEYAADLDRRHAEAAEDKRRTQTDRMGALIATVGLLSGISLLFELSGYFADHDRMGPAPGEPLLSYLIGNLAWIMAVAGLIVFVWLIGVHRRQILATLRSLLWPDGSGPPDRQ